MIQYIEIPFSEKMAISALSSYKICTTRREKKGVVGDLFKIKGITFRIVDIQEWSLGDVTDKLFLCEGVDTPEQFVALWKSLHRGHYNPEKKMWVHWFAKG